MPTTSQRALKDANFVSTLMAVSNDGSNVPIQVEADPATGRLLVNSSTIGNPSGSLVPLVYDAIVLSAGTVPATVKYYVGGISGTLVATLSITYDGGGNILTVART